MPGFESHFSIYYYFNIREPIPRGMYLCILIVIPKRGFASIVG